MLVKALRNVSFGTFDIAKDDIKDVPTDIYIKISNDVEIVSDKSEKVVEENKILTSKDVKKK